MKFDNYELENVQIGSLKMYEKNTGKEIMELTDCSIEYISDTYTSEEDEKVILNYNRDFSGELNLDMSKDAVKALFAIDESKVPDVWTITYTTWVQAKKHKKKRINKKWLKKYGHKPIICESTGWEMNSRSDGSVDLMKKF